MHYIKSYTKTSILLFIFSMFSISCVSTTNIKALDNKNEIDKDVKIHVDGKYVGDGEVQYSDKKTVYTSVPFFELREEGCKTIKEKLDTETNWLNTLGGAVLFGVGMGLVIRAADDRDNREGLLAGGIALSITGIIPMFWGRKYVPVQEWQFQCVKTVD